jgi:diamine N-acetyltransferase
MLRYGADRALGDIGIAIDPAILGQGIGTRVLRAFARYLKENEAFERLSLDVAAYNERAIRAYRAAGFAQTAQHWGEADPGVDIEALARREGERVAPFVRREGDTWRLAILHMEMRLDAETFA